MDLDLPFHSFASGFCLSCSWILDALVVLHGRLWIFTVLIQPTHGASSNTMYIYVYHCSKQRQTEKKTDWRSKSIRSHLIQLVPKPAFEHLVLFIADNPLEAKNYNLNELILKEMDCITSNVIIEYWSLNFWEEEETINTIHNVWDLWIHCSVFSWNNYAVCLCSVTYMVISFRR